MSSGLSDLTGKPRSRSAALLRFLLLAAALTALVTQPAVAGNRPVGTAMPVGDLPAWHQVLGDDFKGTRLDTSKWDPYEGQPGGSGSAWTGWWDPSHVVVHDGVLELRTYRDPRFNNRWISGGLSNNKSSNMEYGKYEVRFRADAGYGVNMVLLLWPDDNSWPPEIDFAENGAADEKRYGMSATLHYGPDDHFTQYWIGGDFTQWHTMGLEWSPGRIAYTKDGATWAVITGSTVPAKVMHFAAAGMAGVVGDKYHPAPDSRTPSEVDLQIDWVAVYAFRPRS